MAATTQVRFLVWTLRYMHNAPTQAQQELRTSARLAQPVEHKALNLVVVGSSPTVGDMFAKHESRKPSNQGIVPGKTPAILGFEDQRPIH